MPTAIERDEVRRLVADGAQLVEVLPARQYEEEHLPGAISLPLGELDRDSAARLRRDRPVIVYCYDHQWDLSARAAWRLESLGFTDVYRYVAGKRDWAASGLPREGERAREPSAGDAARTDIPTCRLGDHVGEVRERVRAAGWDRCVVVTDRAVVLGLLRGDALAADPDRRAEDAMESGPQTFRPDVRLAELVEFLRKHERDSALITTGDGVLIGSLTRRDAERRLGRGA